MQAPRLRVILVGSLYESNIGATSRAMANMGARDLILINPQCSIGLVAQKAAATGQEALRNRKVFQTWQDFTQNENLALRIAFTARDGRGRDVRDFKETLNLLSPRQNLSQIDLVFGPEDRGLANEDIDQCHYSASIPTFGENPSLNLGQAVLLALFIAQSELAPRPCAAEPGADDLPGHLPENLLRDWVQSLGFDLSPERRINVHLVLRRLFMHSVPTRKEVAALNVVLQQSIRKMQEYREMRKLLGLHHDGQSGRPLSDLLP